MDNDSTPSPDERSLESFIDLQAEALQHFKADAPSLWRAFVILDRVFALTIPVREDVQGDALPILMLADDAWRSYLNAAATAARQQASEPFMFCRRGCEAAVYAARIASFKFGTSEYTTVAAAWANRRNDRAAFDRHFKGRDKYERLGDLVLKLYAFRSEFSEYGPHASAQASDLHLLQELEVVSTTPFATSPTRVRDGAINVLVVFHWVAEIMIHALEAVGLRTADAGARLVDFKVYLAALMQDPPLAAEAASA